MKNDKIEELKKRNRFIKMASKDLNLSKEKININRIAEEEINNTEDNLK